jgi:twitching motility protein PilT
MRDFETIQTVLTAAETGHLVFSTLHTNSAVQTIDRIIDCFPAGSHRQIRQQLASVLQGVVSLRLIERGSGTGMVAAVEILRQSPRVSKLIADGSLDALQEEIENSVTYHRMQSMNQSLAALVLNGAITQDAAMRSSNNPADLDLLLRRFLYSIEKAAAEEADMASSPSDFSKILELQEIRSSTTTSRSATTPSSPTGRRRSRVSRPSSRAASRWVARKLPRARSCAPRTIAWPGRSSSCGTSTRVASSA